MAKRIIEMDMNRIEGDLEIKIEVDGNTVTDAWCIGTMYRGYEQILLGRDPKDALVITPRMCVTPGSLTMATGAIRGMEKRSLIINPMATATLSPRPRATRIRLRNSAHSLIW
jgi:hydrogenase large subunit